MKKLILLGLTALLGACHSMTPTPKASLDGEVFYLQRIALPPTATLSVSLQDVSLMDAPAVTLAEQKGPVKGQVPLPFPLSRIDRRWAMIVHRSSSSSALMLLRPLLSNSEIAI